jgi:hypothetical protein
MSEPMSPQQPAQKKGLGPVAWILIGCLGILLIGAIGFGACSFFVAKKVKDVAQEFSDNPAKAAAELAVKLNPELEKVESDEAAETITVRNKKTGEVMTLDWSEIEQGNFSFKSKDGEFKVDASDDGEGAVVSVTGADGQSTQFYGGSAAGDVPDWIPLPDGAGPATSAFSSKSGQQVSGTFGFTTSESVDDVVAFYAEKLGDAGYETNESSYSGGGQRGGGVTATNQSEGRTVGVGVAETEEGTQVTISYSHGG